MNISLKLIMVGLGLMISSSSILAADVPMEKPAPDYSSRILTPPPPATPRINGARIYGQRPGRPFLFTIPATGDRPISFSADDLPQGLTLDASTGRITGLIKDPGEFTVTLHAKNDKGIDEKKLEIVIGDKIGLTPPMGWNSWNCWAVAVDQEKVLRSAKAMANSGLINHGWTYINIDDAWQGTRGGEFNGIQPNEKFPDIKSLADEIHNMGLKIGIYSTPWVTSYAGFCGGSSNSADGKWDKSLATKEGRNDGQYPMADHDAKQWSAWGIDYLKYDWNPRSTKTSNEKFHEQTETMARALVTSGRDIFFSYSNSMPFDQIDDQSKLLNSWRTTGDIRDSWWSLSGIGFSQDKWTSFCGPGHWNDPDMLVVGYVGWGPKLHPSNLTADEQFTHISLWSLLSAPMLIGCDLERLDAFTLSLLTNDEVIAIDQDALGKPATLVATQGPQITIERTDRPNRPPRKLDQGQVWVKELEDGSRAVGLFNVGNEEMTVTAKWDDLKLEGKQTVRDVWRQKDVAEVEKEYEATVAPHGVVLVKLSAAK